MTQHGANSTQIAQVANVTKGDTFDAEIARDADKPGFTPPGVDPDDTEDPPKPKHTYAELSDLVVVVTAAGKKKEAAEIVHRYAERVSKIPEDKIDEAYKAIKALKGEDDEGTDA